MALPPIVSITLQSAVLSVTSNLLAQAITAYKDNTPLVIDWVPVFQFFVFTCVCTPPNFLWQDFLEQTFPAYHVAPTREAIASASAGDDKELDREATEGRLVEPRLNIRHTLTKTLLDQTAGAAVNTLLFSLFIGSIQAAMAHKPAAHHSLGFLASGRAVDYGQVDWAEIVARARADFWTILRAGWTFWPFVSLVNFAFVKDIQTRNLIGGLAGVVWGIYMSLLAAQ